MGAGRADVARSAFPIPQTADAGKGIAEMSETSREKGGFTCWRSDNFSPRYFF
ncbi:MAG: hypothetical protein JWR77_2513 [Rhizorhabdus sp.]|nr:hypothetical protein [Rhizorhabdus sp.]